MALATAIVWEVRSAGADTNGGGFKAGASGTDFSQQDAAQASGTDLVIDAVLNTKVTSATHNFVAADVGNVVQITAGTGFTTGFYEIVSVAANAATLDRSAGTTGSTGGTWALGGALATPTKAINTAMVGSNTVYIKKATYLQTAAITPPAGVAGSPTIVVGYNATRGDLDAATAFTNHPSFKNNNVTSTVLTPDNGYGRIRNLIFDGGTAASKAAFGVYGSGIYTQIVNCQATNCTDVGFYPNSGTWRLVRCQVTGMVGSPTGAFYADAEMICIACRANANPCPGFRAPGGGIFIDCISDGNTANVGFRFGAATIMDHCIAYNNGSDGVYASTSAGMSGLLMRNCIISQNGGYGISSMDTWSELLLVDYNAFYSNTSGARSGVPAGAHDVALTADPFTDAANGDFSLNSTVGGGAACRNAGYPGVLSGV